jgi:valyl-tRNA synthetase
MSKQLGNSPDPLDLIAKYGADGMRVAMMLSSSAGNDVMFDEALCEQGRNFGNKIWNAYRLISMWQVDENIAQSDNNAISVEWFKHTLSKAISEINADRRYKMIVNAVSVVDADPTLNISDLVLQKVDELYTAGALE